MVRHPSMDNEEVRKVFERVQKEGTNDEHVPYGERNSNLECRADFEVEYLFNPDPMVENIVLRQGLRCDFLYEGDQPKLNGIHMIWPEFSDVNNEVIRDKNVNAPSSGKATMWIVDHESRVKFHQPRIKVGTKGFWVAGSFKIASVTVTKILGLFTNTQ